MFVAICIILAVAGLIAFVFWLGHGEAVPPQIVPVGQPSTWRQHAVDDRLAALEKAVNTDNESVKHKHNWKISILDDGKFGWTIVPLVDIQYQSWGCGTHHEQFESYQNRVKESTRSGEAVTYKEARKAIVQALVDKQIDDWFTGNKVEGAIWV